MAEPTVQQMESYIRDAARARGIDPNVAVRVARSEGLRHGVWQSNSKRGSTREPSYGPFQLLVGGPGTGFPRGLGNAFMRATGLDPRSKSSVFAQIDFALNAAARHGWGQWYGAAKVGVDRWTGLRGAQQAPINREAVAIAQAPLPKDGPLPSPRPVQMAETAPIPTGRPALAPTQFASAAPAPERFGGRGSAPLAAPVMAGFADPARFGRTPMAPQPAAARGGRVGSGAFSAPPDPARFGPPPSAPLQAPRMAPGPIDPARFGQVPIAHHIPAPAPNPAPAPPQMRSPRSMEVGPGALSLDAFPPELAPTPMAAPVAPPPPPAPALPQPTMVRSLPVHETAAGFPAPVQQSRFTPMDVYSGRANEAVSSSGNRVSADPFGNTSVTNRFGATTVMTPNGQAFGSPIAGPLGQGQANLGIQADAPDDRQRHGFGGLKTVGGGLAGARMGGMVGGLPGLAIGGLLGGLLGRELSKPGGGMFANSPIGGLLGGQQNTVNDGLVRNSVLGNVNGGSPSFVTEGRQPTRREMEALGVTFREGDKSGQAERAKNSVGLY